MRICTYVCMDVYAYLPITFQTVDDNLSALRFKFFDLVDKLMSLLSAVEKLPFDLFKLCHDLKASDSIPLFSPKYMQRFSNCKSVFNFKIYLLPFITWFDHSILNELVAISCNDNAKELLDQFDCKIDKKESVSSYHIPTPSQLMIPLDDSEYTILAVKLYDHQDDIKLCQVEEIKLLMTKTLKITDHAVQLIAVHITFGYLYWMIPKHVVSIIQHNLKLNHISLWQKKIAISILPDGLFASTFDYGEREKLRGPFSLLYFQGHDDNAEHKVCMYVRICIYANEHAHTFVT